MIEKYFASKPFVKSLRSGPVSAALEQVAESLEKGGYSTEYIRSVLACTHKFGVFARTLGREAPDFDDALIGRFVIEGGVAASLHSHKLRSMRKHLAELGLLSGSPGDVDPFFDVLTGFDKHLCEARGVVVQTRQQRISTARHYLAWYRRERPGRPLSEMSPADVLTACHSLLARPASGATKSKVSLAIRSFLRYLRLQNVLEKDLAYVVPTVMHYQLASVPKHLSWELVRKLVRSVDVSRAPGKRDKAILLLVAGLALRNGAIQRIELDHISWRSAELRVPTTKGGKGLVLPLSQEVGDALSDYILHERPKSKSRVVFLRHTRPHGALMSKSTITEMIKARLRSEGIKGPGGATTLLRHSLATQLVNSGVPIKDISDTFGHSSINTTAIYSKVHYSALAEVALPFPGSEVA